MQRLIHLLLTALITLGAWQTSHACGNEYGHTLEGIRIYTQHFFLSERMLHMDKEAVKDRLNTLEATVAAGNDDYRTWSDIAVNLMKLGQADSAIRILRPLLAERPNEYNLLANLGTSYELAGELDSALKYIEKGYRLNAGSHGGSEWIHVAILKAKIKERQSPGWLESNEIIQTETLVKRVEDGHLRSGLAKIDRHFTYQIRTRAPFTPAPNKVIANLLTTLGDMHTEVGTYEHALLSYGYALKFQGNPYLQRRIRERIGTLNRLRADLENVEELPPMFMNLMKRSKLSPELLLVGLYEFAEEQDALHLQKLAYEDSMHHIRHQLDSLQATIMAVQQAQVKASAQSSQRMYFLVFLAFVLGIGLALGVRRWL